MSDDLPVRHTRTVVSPGPVAKLLVLVGVLLGLFAVYLAFSPIERPARDGHPVSCGTAFRLPIALSRVACGQANTQRQWQAGTALIAGLLVAAGGMWAYGGSRRVEFERPAARVVAGEPSVAPPLPPREAGTL